MSMIGKQVRHKLFGAGIITERSERHITVCFANRTARFSFPDAFKSFLSTEDPVLLEEIGRIDAERAAEAARMAAEAERLAEQERLRREEERAEQERRRRSDHSSRSIARKQVYDTIALAVGDTYDLVLRYGITAHPIGAPYPSGEFSYMVPIKKGGAMERVFRIQDIIECLPDELEGFVSRLDADTAGRLETYHIARKSTFGYGKQNTVYRFYICSEEARIEQPFERRYIQISCRLGYSDLPLVGKMRTSDQKAPWETAEDAWIIPCDPSLYDVFGAFGELDRISWKQSTNVQIGDIVYIYIGAPVRAVAFRCQAERVDLPYDDIDDSRYIIDGTSFQQYGRYMELVLLDKLSGDEWSYDVLKEHGLHGSPRGPRRITGELAAYIDGI